MTIPKNWVVVPQEELDKFQSYISETHKEKIEYDLALQSNSSIGWFVHPYILIQIDNRGRQYTQRQIEGGIKKSNIAKNFDSKKKKYKNILFELDDGAVFYDREKNILYTKLTLYEEKTKIYALLSQILTKFGAIRVMFYDHENSYLDNVSLMKNFLKTIIVDSNKQYSIEQNKSEKYSDPFGSAVSVGILSIITFIIMRMRGRNNN